jgi:hypothetical protein
MVGIALIAAGGIFVIGIVVGIIILVSVGIRREENSFREERRFLEEHGIWDSPNGPDRFLLEKAPDGVSSVGRSLNGLYVRHLPLQARRDADRDVQGS